MPRYEATLENGQVLTMESDHPPTEEEVRQLYGQWQKQQKAPAPPRTGGREKIEAPDVPYTPEPETSALGTLTREAALAIAPTVAAKEAGEIGIGLGAGFGVPGMITGALVVGGGAGALADYGQEQLLKVAVPDFWKDVESGRKEHPVASTIGRLGAGFGLFRPDLKTIPNALRSLKYWRTGTTQQRKLVTDALKNLGIGAASGVVTPLLHGNAPSTSDVLLGAGQAALYGSPYSWARGKYSPGSTFMNRQLEKQALKNLTERIANASQEQEAAAVHEPVPTQPGQGQQQVPTTPSGERVRTEPQGVGKETQVSLEPSTPQVSGNDRDGWKVVYAGRFELGFPTREAANQAGAEAVGGKRTLKYAEGQPISRDELQKLHKEQEEEQQKQLGITEEEAAIRDAAERAAIDEADKFKADVQHGHGPDDNVPFGVKLGGREFFKALGQNRIAFNRGEFRRWVSEELYRKGFSREEIEQAVRNRVHEEWLHNVIIDAFPGASGRAALRMFWNSLSPIERAVVQKKYHDDFTRKYRVDYEGKKVRDEQGRPIPRFTEYQLAHEALRQMLQREFGLPESEISQTMAVENFSLRALGALQRLMRSARQAMGGKMSVRGREVYEEAQQAIANVIRDKGRVKPSELRIPGEQQPAAVFRGGEEESATPSLEQLQQKKLFLATYVGRAQKQVDAADLRGDHSTAANWQSRVDNARQQLEQVERDITRLGSERSFPAAGRRDEEARLKRFEDLVGRLTRRVAESTGDDKQMWQKRLDEAIAERDRVKGGLPPQATKRSDRQIYDDLQTQIREHIKQGQMPPQDLLKQIETVKNRHGGKPPTQDMPAALRRAVEADDDFKRFVNQTTEASDKMEDALDKLMVGLMHHESGAAQNFLRFFATRRVLDPEFSEGLNQLRKLRDVPEVFRSMAQVLLDRISQISEYRKDPRWDIMRKVTGQGQDKPELDAFGDIAPISEDTKSTPDTGAFPAAITRDKSKNVVLRMFPGRVAPPDQILSTLRNRLHPDEYKALQDAGIEKFLTPGSKFNPKEVAQWIDHHGPRVEVLFLGGSKGPSFYDESVARLNEVRTTLAREYPGFYEIRPDGRAEYLDLGLFGSPPPQVLDLVNDYNKLKAEVDRNVPQHRQRAAEVTHELDTDYPDWRDIYGFAEENWYRLPERQRELMRELQGLEQDEWDMPNPEEGYTEAGIAVPKAREKMQEPVDILVRIPSSREYYSSEHYGGEKGKNLIAHVRGYMEMKNGKRIFHVIEVQSDWAQDVRRQAEYLNSASAENPTGWGTADMNKFVQQSAPLLRHYERLSLKAAIDHARENGAQAIAISDAETAMMSEGHDRRAAWEKGPYDTIEEAEAVTIRDRRALSERGTDEEFGSPYVSNTPDGKFMVVSSFGRNSMQKLGYRRAPVPQEKGMRLHYDQILPKIARELTGDPGTVVDFGHHVHAFLEGRSGEDYTRRTPRPNLVFEESPGVPKTKITARMYDISKAKREFSLFDRDVAGPAAGRRKQDAKKEPLLFGNLTERGEQADVGEAPKAVPPQERAIELPPLTPEQIEAARREPPNPQEIYDVLKPAITAPVPSYENFHDQMTKAFGKHIANAWAPELWENATWKELLAATPERLSELVRDFELGPKLGLKKLPVPTERDVARARKEGQSAEAIAQLEKQVELFKGKAPKLGGDAMKSMVERMQRSPRFKSGVISAIGRRMLEDVLAIEEPKYSKNALEFDDIAFSTKSKRTKYPGYYEFGPGEASSPKVLTEILSDGARAGSSAPVSASYRVVALRNRWNGKIELLSVYNHGREGIVIYRPDRGAYRPMSELPPNLKFYATFLMKEPLQKFAQYFKNTADFQNHFDTKNAMRLSTPREEAEATVPRSQRPIEGSEGIEGGAGGVQGPESDLVLAMRGLGTGELERAVSGDAPLTGSEAGALHSVMKEMDITAPEDMAEMIHIFDSMAQQEQLRGRHYQALAALYKIAGAIQRSASPEEAGPPKPALSKEQLYEETLRSAFNSFKDIKSREGFIHDALLNFGWEPTRFGEPTRPPTVSRGPTTGAREVTMIPRRPPTDVAGLPPGQAPEMTTANPGTISGPEYLSQSVRDAMEQLRTEGAGIGKGIFPTIPLGPGEYGGPKFKGEVPKGVPREMPHEAQVSYQSRKSHYKQKPPPKAADIPTFTKGGQGKMNLEGPAASRRFAEEYFDELERYRKVLTTAVSRGATFRDIKSQADGVDRSSEVYAIRNANSIRWKSIGKAIATGAERFGLKSMFDRPEAVRVRKAVVPWNAALRIAEAEEWDRVRKEWDAVHKKKKEAMEGGYEFNVAENEPKFVQPEVPKAHHFDQLIIEAEKGIAKARDMMNSPVVGTRRTGRRYLKGAEELLDLAKWTKENLEHPNLRATADQFRAVMNEHLNLLLLNGADIASRRYYVPSRYGGEMWDDGMMTFGDERVLGKQQRLPKVFEDYYDAIQAGPYYPVNLDTAALAQHSMISGARAANWQMWGDLLKGTVDPVTKKPVALAPTMRPVHFTAPNPETGVMEQHTRLEPQVPKGKIDYELVNIGGPKGSWIAVRTGYKPLVEAMLAQSKVPDFPLGKAALYTAQGLKHGVILLLDTFHPGRLFQYASVLGGRGWLSLPGRPGWKSGWSALSWHPEDIPKAVEANLLTKEQAQWALEPIKVYDRNVVRTMTRHELASIFLSQGLNATQQADALYRNAVQKVPGIGDWWYKHAVSPVTKFTFDRYTPGLITEMAVRNFERLNKGNRSTPMLRQIRDIARDTNAFYGNMGRQGFFKDPTFRDLAQIFMLAPLWQEGLIRKELTTAYRLSAGSLLYAAGEKGARSKGSYDAFLGPMAHGMVRGLGTYFILTQALNLITKGHFTWQNKEEGRKMDAWLPIGNGEGIWISPLSVFAETTHDFIRLYQTRGTAWEAATRLGFNKMGPFGRMFNILHDMQTPSGEAITSTMGVAKEAGKQLLPLPISLGAMMQEGGYQLGRAGIIPPVIKPTAPGSMAQRGLSAVGVKSELDRRAEQDVARLASNFVRNQGLKFQPMKMTPTDEASYAKLRGALRNKDYAGAKKILRDLRKMRTDEQILHGMKIASTRPFTGSNQAEELFLYSLNNDQLDLYTRANQNRAQYYQDFLEWFMQQQ